MKKIIFISLIIFLANSCLVNKNNSRIDIETERKINLIINDRKIYLSNLVYDSEIDLIKRKYNISKEINFSDVSLVKIEEDFGMYSIFGENDNRQIIDSLGDKIVNKWKKLNYDPNYYFHYDKIVSNIHLSFLKMMDFYNSDDMKNYEDSLRISLVKRYNLNDSSLREYINDEYNFKNRQIWKYQNDSILTLKPIEILKNR
jgi:hypothetical protein